MSILALIESYFVESVTVGSNLRGSKELEQALEDYQRAVAPYGKSRRTVYINNRGLTDISNTMGRLSVFFRRVIDSYKSRTDMELKTYDQIMALVYSDATIQGAKVSASTMSKYKAFLGQLELEAYGLDKTAKKLALAVSKGGEVEARSIDGEPAAMERLVDLVMPPSIGHELGIDLQDLYISAKDGSARDVIFSGLRDLESEAFGFSKLMSDVRNAGSSLTIYRAPL